MATFDPFTATLSTFALIALAEVGDKSQLVCITLAIRHHHLPVMLGAMLAFAILNTVAVMFGAGIATWLPERLVAGLVAVLFAVFAIHLFFTGASEEEEAVTEKSGYGVLLSTLTLILVAEFGDKTQIAVSGLASTMNPIQVWFGATAALVAVSAVGIGMGRTVLQRFPIVWMHRIGGGIFVLFALFAAWRAIA